MTSRRADTMIRVSIPFEARTMGTRIVGTKGSGKSRLAGRLMAWSDFAAYYPVVIIDPVGPLIDNVLDVLLRLPKEHQDRAQLADRVVYAEVSGSYPKGYVAPFPFLQRQDGESLYDTASRFVATALKTDPDLHRNPQLGANSLIRMGTYVGMICAALGWQLTEAEALLDDPKAFESQIRAAVAQFPEELAEAAHFLLQVYPKWRPNEKLMQTASFRAKLHLLANPNAKAMYGASQPAIDWDEVVAKRQLVLLDFRHVPELHKRFTVTWVHDHLMDWVRRRGPGRHVPLSVYIDEATYLLGDATARVDPLADDLEELISRLARNHRIWLTYIHQELNQLNPKASRLFNDLGIQLYGRTADIETAIKVANRFYRWKGDEVRKTEHIYHGTTMFEAPYYETRTTEFTRDEWAYRNALRFLDLPDMHFLAGVAPREGVLPTHLQEVDISRYQAGQYVQEELVTELRRLLMHKHPKTEDILEEIRGRTRQVTLPAGESLPQAPADFFEEATPPLPWQ